MPHTTHTHIAASFTWEGPLTGPCVRRSIDTVGGQTKAHDGSGSFPLPFFEAGRRHLWEITFLDDTDDEITLPATPTSDTPQSPSQTQQ